MTSTIRFIHISDTHIGPDSSFKRNGILTLPAAERLVDEIVRLPFTPDFIIHTGDIVHELPTLHNSDSYKAASAVLNRLMVPVYYVTGNHDSSEPIRKYLLMGRKKWLSKTLNSYVFEMGGFRFVTLDARGPDEIDPQGQLSAEQIDIVQRELSTGKTPLVFFIHYPPLPLDCLWIERDMLILNGGTLHTLLRAHAKRIRGVFLGHVHRGVQLVQDGVLYSSVGSPFVQFNMYPQQEKFTVQTDAGGFFNIVTLSNDQLVIKQQSYR